MEATRITTKARQELDRLYILNHCKNVEQRIGLLKDMLGYTHFCCKNPTPEKHLRALELVFSLERVAG